MIFERNDELTAYSVQDLGAVWQWRVYSARGDVVLQGVSLTQLGAQHAGLTALCRAQERRAA